MCLDYNIALHLANTREGISYYCIRIFSFRDAFPTAIVAHRFCRQWRDCLNHDTTTDKGALEGHTYTDWPCISRPNWTLLENYSETVKEEEDLIARPTLLSLLQGPGCLLSAALLRTNEWQLWHGCQDVIARVCSLSVSRLWLASSL